MTWKKVSNSDPGDADHFGGDDTDKISDLFSGVDVDDVDINSDWTFRSGKLLLRNPGNTFSYQVVPAAIAANRILNLPLLTATDTLVGEATSATLTNKTLDSTCNVDNAALSGDIVKETTSNDHGDFDNSFRDNRLRIWNPADTFRYTIIAQAIAANRQLNLPLTTGTDTLASLGLGQTFTGNNTFSGTTIINTPKLGTNARALIVDTPLSAERTFTFPNVNAGGAATTNSSIHVQTHEYYEVEDEMFTGSISATNTSNQIGVLNWGMSAAGTATPSTLSGVSSHPGIVQLATGTTSGNDERIHLGDSATKNSINLTDFLWIGFIVRIPTITSITVRIGVGQDLSAASFGTSGAFFLFDAATDADNWQTVTRTASTSTTNVVTDITVDANDWFLLEIVQNASNNYEFYVNNVLKFTHSTNKPTGGHVIGLSVTTNTNASRTLDFDYFRLRTQPYGQRWT